MDQWYTPHWSHALIGVWDQCGFSLAQVWIVLRTRYKMSKQLSESFKGYINSSKLTLVNNTFCTLTVYITWQVSYIDNKWYEVYVLGQAVEVTFMSFGVNFCLWGMHYAKTKIMPAVSCECTWGWLKPTGHLSIPMPDFFKHKRSKLRDYHTKPASICGSNFGTTSTDLGNFLSAPASCCILSN